MTKLNTASVTLRFPPPTRTEVENAQAFWDRLNAEQRAVTLTRRTGPGEPWPFPASAYTTPAGACAPGSWDAAPAPTPAPAPVREHRQADPEPWPNAPEKPAQPAPRSEWVAAPIAKLKW